MEEKLKAAIWQTGYQLISIENRIKKGDIIDTVFEELGKERIETELTYEL